MCRGLVVNECGGQVRTAPLKFTFVIHSFVTKDKVKQVLWFRKGNEPLAEEQSVVFHLHMGGPAFAR